MDLFGVPITFIGAHRLYYQTKLGGICSVLMIAYLMYLVDLINLNVMTVITNTVFSYDPEQITLNQGNLLFAIRVNQSINSYIYNPYLTFQLQWKQKNKNSQDLIVNIPFAPCTQQDFINLEYYNLDTQNEIKLYNISDWVCPQFGQSGYNLTGKYNSQKFEYLKVSATLCNQSQSSKKWNFSCPSQNDISNFLQSQQGGVRIDFIYSNLNVNPNIQDGFQGFVESQQYFTLNPLMQRKELDIFLRSWTVQTDNQIFSVDSPLKQIFLYEDPKEIIVRDIVQNLQLDTVIASLYFRASQYNIESQRTFLKLSAYLSYIGGLFNSIYVGLGLVISFYCRYQLWLKLFKINYTIIKQDYQQDRKARLIRKGQSALNSRDNIINHSEITKTNMSNLVKDKFHPDNTIVPNLKELVKMALCYFIPKQDTTAGTSLLEAISVVEKDLNIVQYFKLQQDVQKLKQILFNDDQLKIFELQQKQTLVIKDGKFYLHETSSEEKTHKRGGNYRRASRAKKIEIKDNSDLLDSEKNVLYGGHFQKKILQEYHQVLETLNCLETSKQLGLTNLQHLKTQTEQYEKSVEVFAFEQTINKRIMKIFDQDIKDIIYKDALLKPLCFKQKEPDVNQNVFSNQNIIQDKDVIKNNDDDEFQNYQLLSSRSDVPMETKEIELTKVPIKIPGIDLTKQEHQLGFIPTDQIISQSYQIDNFILKMGVLNNLTLQRNLTRIIDTSSQTGHNLSGESVESLLKTIFFRQENILLVDEFVILKYKSQIKRQSEFSPQQILYNLEFSMNVDKFNIQMLHNKVHKFMLKINIENIIQINAQVKEQFLALNKKPFDSKSVSLQLQLGSSNGKYSKFIILLHANIMDINYNPQGLERSIDNLFQQIIDTNVRLSLKLLEAKKKIKSKFYLNNSLSNFIFLQDQDINDCKTLYNSGTRPPIKTHLYLQIDHPSQEGADTIFKFLNSIGTITQEDVKTLKTRSPYFRSLNQIYDHQKVKRVTVLNFRFFSPSYSTYAIEMVLEVQQFENNMICIHQLMNYPVDGYTFYEMVNKRSKNFNTVVQEDNIDMDIIQVIEFIVSVMIKILNDSSLISRRETLSRRI